MARNTGKRRIHQKPMLWLVLQHLRRRGRGTTGQHLCQGGCWSSAQGLAPRSLHAGSRVGPLQGCPMGFSTIYPTRTPRAPHTRGTG